MVTHRDGLAAGARTLNSMEREGPTIIRKIALAAVLMAASFLTLAPAPAHADGWKQPVVTVSSTAPHSWGVGLAVRQWNAGRVDGQPRLVLVADKWADVRVRVVSKPHQWWSGYTQPHANVRRDLFEQGLDRYPRSLVQRQPQDGEALDRESRVRARPGPISQQRRPLGDVVLRLVDSNRWSARRVRLPATRPAVPLTTTVDV